MNILVTGGAGYLGSVLVPKLLVRGHRVRILDLGYFGVGHLRSMRRDVELVREDIREICEDPRESSRVLNEIDCVIHLAAISNDPSAELDPALTHQVNFRATQALAESAKARGVRFIFSSSCSVYGEAPEEVTALTSRVLPRTGSRTRRDFPPRTPSRRSPRAHGSARRHPELDRAAGAPR